MTAKKDTKAPKKAAGTKKKAPARPVTKPGNINNNEETNNVPQTPMKNAAMGRSATGEPILQNGGDYGDGGDYDASPQKGRNFMNGENANGGSGGYIDPPRDKNRYKYRVEIQQMMFVSGETNDPPERTTDLIEDIVRDQVIALLIQAQRNAFIRGQKSILPEDMIFLIRHDKAKVNRLRTYLSWKDVRKGAKEQEGGDFAAAAGDNLIEDAGAGAVDNKISVTKQKKYLKLPWELEFMFTEQPLIGGISGNMDDEKIDEEEREAVLAQIKRLRQNDERTRNMTQQEYVHWSECRQASFTFRKGKRFREWCGIAQVTEVKPSDDVIDILGFLTFEIVCSLTEEALKIKASMDRIADDRDARRYLFMEPSNDNKPISPEHIQEAWRRLQRTPRKKQTLHNFRGGRIRREVRLI
jgi:transcription initiation protein SPT3